MKMYINIAEAKTHNEIRMEVQIKSKDDAFVQLVEKDQALSSPRLKHIARTAHKSMRKGMKPELCEEGVGGTYFLRDTNGKRIGVFKPQDEEPFSVNNPKGFSPKRRLSIGENSSEVLCGFKEGILVGEASLRECAAFALDHESFSGVPPTELALCQHSEFYSNPEGDSAGIESSTSPSGLCFLTQPLGEKAKLGSLQEFIEHDGDTEDLGTSFISKFPVDEVHKIAVLDIRLCNTDRHGGNILWKEVEDDEGNLSYKLIPIDHGYTLPSTLSEASFTWEHWPQSKQKMSQSTKDYIKNLDAERDIQLLKRKFGRTMREEHYKVLHITTALLKRAAEADLTFHQIADIMCRQSPFEPCILEKICNEAVNAQGDFRQDESRFWDSLCSLMDMVVEQQKTNAMSNTRTQKQHLNSDVDGELFVV